MNWFSPQQIWAALKPLRPFFLGLFLAVVLALLAPSLGARDGPLQTRHLTGWAVALIFLVQGLQLPAGEVRRGFTFWPVHVFCQAWMFLVFPCFGFLLTWLLADGLPAAFRIGLLYLCFLPTTVATNAAFSTQAGGNGAVSLFNIVVGNLAGIFISPAVLAWLLQQRAGVEIDLRPLLQTLAWQIVLPFLLGQLGRRRLAEWIESKKHLCRITNNYLIFFIVYAALCNFLTSHHLPDRGTGLGILLLGTLALLGGGSLACWLILRKLPWKQEFRVSAFYSSTQKTLAAGLPMAGALYVAAGNDATLPPLALVILPLLLYHIGQLILGALLIPFFQQHPGDS